MKNLRWTTNKTIELPELNIGKIIRIERNVMSRNSSYDEYEEDCFAWAFNVGTKTFRFSNPMRDLWKGKRTITLTKSEKGKIVCSRAHYLKKAYGYDWSKCMRMGWEFVKEFELKNY